MFSYMLLLFWFLLYFPIFFYQFSPIMDRVIKHTFLNMSRGPGGFRELLEVCWNHSARPGTQACPGHQAEKTYKNIAKTDKN